MLSGSLQSLPRTGGRVDGSTSSVGPAVWKDMLDEPLTPGVKYGQAFTGSNNYSGDTLKSLLNG